MHIRHPLFNERRGYRLVDTEEQDHASVRGPVDDFRYLKGSSPSAVSARYAEDISNADNFIPTVTFRRRQFLATIGGLSMATLTGCSAITDSLNEGSPDGVGEESLEKQKTVIEQFVTAVNENDIETVNASVSGWASGAFTEDNIGEYSLELGELSRKSGDGPEQQGSGYDYFNTDLTIAHAGDTRTVKTDIGVFATEEYGDWKVSSIQVTEGKAFIIDGTVLGTPTVIFEGSYDGDATSSEDTGVLTITHMGGNTFPTTETTVWGTIVDPNDSSPDITTSEMSLKEATGNNTMSPGDSVTVGVESDYTVHVGYKKVGDIAVIGNLQKS